ncbi:MAG: HypC/HybG/HupF family hydrogenase formation chaperone [Clostridiaceae bacterium]
MCLGVPAKVVEIKGTMASVDVLGAVTDVSIAFVNGVKPGDYVIVHAGCAIQILDEDEASKTLELFRELEDLADE